MTILVGCRSIDSYYNSNNKKKFGSTYNRLLPLATRYILKRVIYRKYRLG